MEQAVVIMNRGGEGESPEEKKVGKEENPSSHYHQCIAGGSG